MELQEGQAGDPGALSSAGGTSRVTRSPTSTNVPAATSVLYVDRLGVLPGGEGQSSIAGVPQSPSTNALLTRGKTVSTQTSPEMPLPVAPIVDMSGKASGGVGWRFKAGESPISPAIVSLVSGEAKSH